MLLKKKSGSRVITWTCSEAMRSASFTISSSVSHTITSPKSSQAFLAASAVGRIASSRPTSPMVARASFSALVSSTAVEGRRAGDDAFDARHLGGYDRHVGGGHHRVAPARHVAADARDRDMAVAQDDARQRLDLEIAHRLLLLLGEMADLALGEFD